MPTILQLRRGTTAEHSSFTGEEGEVTINTSKDTLVVHDGSTQGGFELALADGSNLSSTSATTVVSDTTPQLGGDLDVNGNAIVSTSNNNIEITPDGTGYVRLDGNVDIQSGEIVLKNSGSVSNIKFYCESSNAHYAQLQSPAHSEFSGNVTVTLPASSDTLVGLATSDTLTNKTLTSPDINGGTIDDATIDGRDVGADGSKLDGIEANATADQTASEILTAISTVDGASSGLDADLLDGQHGSYYTQYTDTAIANLVDSAPSTLDTLNELAAALGDDANFSTTVTNSIALKATIASPTFTGTVTVPTADINGGDIDGTAIGDTTPAAGSFTTLSFSDTFTVGYDVSVTAAGSDQSGATSLSKTYNVVTTASANQGVKLFSAAPGVEVTIKNDTSVNIKIYPNTGETINGGTANAAIDCPAGSTTRLMGASSTDWDTLVDIVVYNSSGTRLN